VSDVIQFPLDCGSSVLVEVAPPPGVSRVGRHDTVLQDARLSFEKALTGVRDAASAALGQFQSMGHRPDQIEITFGVKLDAKLGAIIAETGVQGALEIKLTWRRGDAPPEP